MEQKSVMRGTCLKETANLGVNIVIDQRTSFQGQVTYIIPVSLNVTLCYYYMKLDKTIWHQCWVYMHRKPEWIVEKHVEIINY